MNRSSHLQLLTLSISLTRLSLPHNRSVIPSIVTQVLRSVLAATKSRTLRELILNITPLQLTSGIVDSIRDELGEGRVLAGLRILEFPLVPKKSLKRADRWDELNEILKEKGGPILIS